LGEPSLDELDWGEPAMRAVGSVHVDQFNRSRSMEGSLDEAVVDA